MEDSIFSDKAESALSPEELRDIVKQSLDADKALNIDVINLRGQSDMADYMIIASGTSSRHVSSLAKNLTEFLAKKNVKHIRSEGTSQGDWAVLDIGDIIVHLFRPEVREFYNIEKMWKPLTLVNEPKTAYIGA